MFVARKLTPRHRVFATRAFISISALFAFLGVDTFFPTLAFHFAFVNTTVFPSCEFACCGQAWLTDLMIPLSK